MHHFGKPRQTQSKIAYIIFIENFLEIPVKSCIVEMLVPNKSYWQQLTVFMSHSHGCCDSVALDVTSAGDWDLLQRIAVAFSLLGVVENLAAVNLDKLSSSSCCESLSVYKLFCLYVKLRLSFY